MRKDTVAVWNSVRDAIENKDKSSFRVYMTELLEKGYRDMEAIK